MRITTLSNGWQFRSEDATPGYYRPNVQEVPWLPAEVPGAVHLDLVRNGIIAEPMARQYEWGCRWVDERAWHYRLAFDWTPDPNLPRRVLRFNGLDTVCSVRLNGEELARHDNFFVPLEVDVTDRLQPGQNQLEITFESAEKVGKQRRAAYFEANGLPYDTVWFDERAFVRKPGYMFAWDWGPRLVSCGLWQPVELLEFAGRIKHLTWRQEPTAGGFRVWAEAETEGEGTVTTTLAGHQTAENAYELDLARWWPVGEGEPTLHEATATFNGHTVIKRLGLRTLELIQEPDSHGQSFQFAVNGRPIYARGANWIPDDSFPGRIATHDYHAQIKRAKALGMNMLRVWGGGLYEHEAFYDACDEQGILVWQDFPYACSYYPDDEIARHVAREEARASVRRLRDRASLALWCGNNENLILWEGRWGGVEKSPGRYHGEPIYNEVLSQVVAEEDPTRPYIASSPIGEGPDHKGGNSDDFGDQHYWDVWHGRGDWNNYAASRARFCSEFGFASSCSLAQWHQVHEAKTLANPYEAFPSPEVLWHDKTGKGFETFRSYVDLHYPRAETLEDWVYYSQLNQRDALRFGIEWFRRSEFCKGALIWQMNDCWPVQSWAVQDYARLLKPAGHELRRLYAPHLIALEPTEGCLNVWVVNDSPEPLVATLHGRVVDTVTAATVHEVGAHVNVPPGGRKLVIPLLTSFRADQHAAHFWFAGAPETGRWHFLAEPKQMKCSIPTFSATYNEGEVRIRVTGFAADLVVWDPENPTNVRSLLTGEPGWEAYTVADDVIAVAVHERPSKLIARSLSGFAQMRV